MNEDSSQAIITDNYSECETSQIEEIANINKKHRSKFFLFIHSEVLAMFFTIFVVITALAFCLYSFVAPKQESDLTIKRLSENNMYSLRIELNNDPKERFELIQGIGPAIAEKIDYYRKNIKKFDKIEELLNIKGIGKGTLTKMEPYIFIGNAQSEEFQDNPDKNNN